MPEPHFYKHLDRAGCNVRIELNMEQLAELVCAENYGLHRFLSEVIDIKKISKWEKDQIFASELERLLMEGHF